MAVCLINGTATSVQGCSADLRVESLVQLVQLVQLKREEVGQ